MSQAAAIRSEGQAMSASKEYLTRAEQKALGRLSPWRGLGSIAWTWAWIGAAWGLYIWHPTMVTCAVGWVIVCGRHLALVVLMHEGAHRLILRDRKWNDLIASWLTAYPVMLRVEAYRAVHLQHHKATWTDADPDLALARKFPITKKSLLRKVVRDLTGQTGWQRYRLIARLSAGLAPNGRGLGTVPLRSAVSSFVRVQRGFLVTNAAIFALLSAAGHPEAFILLWWLPALTGCSLVLRLRSIAEHAVIGDPADELRQTRTTLAPAWLRFLIAPHHVNYHLEHHLFMFVPHYNLPRAHRLLERGGVLERAEIAASYWEVLKKATSKPDDSALSPRGSILPFGG